MTPLTTEEALLLAGVAADAEFASISRRLDDLEEQMTFLWQQMEALTETVDSLTATEPPDGPPLPEPPDPPPPEFVNEPWRILRAQEEEMADIVFGSTGEEWDGWYDTAWTKIAAETATATFTAMEAAGQKCILIVTGANGMRDEALRTLEKATLPKGEWQSWFDEDEWVANAITLYQDNSVDIGQWVTDGVIVAVYLMDEPNSENSWGVPRTAAEIDRLGYLYKEAFGYHVPTAIRMDPRGFNLAAPGGYQYQYIDHSWAQYTWTKRFSYDPKVYNSTDWWVSTNRQFALDVNMDPDKIIWGIAAQHGGQPNDQPPTPGQWGMPARATSLTGSNQGGTYMRGEEWEEVADAAVPFCVKSGFAVFRYDDTPEPHDWHDDSLGAYKTDFFEGMAYWDAKMTEYTT